MSIFQCSQRFLFHTSVKLPGKPDEIIEILKETKAWRYLRCEIEKYYIVPKKIDTKQILKSGAKNDEKG